MQAIQGRELTAGIRDRRCHGPVIQRSEEGAATVVIQGVIGEVLQQCRSTRYAEEVAIPSVAADVCRVNIDDRVRAVRNRVVNPVACVGVDRAVHNVRGGRCTTVHKANPVESVAVRLDTRQIEQASAARLCVQNPCATVAIGNQRKSTVQGIDGHGTIGASDFDTVARVATGTDTDQVGNQRAIRFIQLQTRSVAIHVDVGEGCVDRPLNTRQPYAIRLGSSGAGVHVDVGQLQVGQTCRTCGDQNATTSIVAIAVRIRGID